MGRLLSGLGNSFENGNIDRDSRHVKKTLVTTEMAVAIISGRWINFRIIPYRTTDNHISEPVLIITETTKSKQLKIALRETGGILSTFTSTISRIIIGLSSDGKIIEYTPKRKRFSGMNGACR